MRAPRSGPPPHRCAPTRCAGRRRRRTACTSCARGAAPSPAERLRLIEREVRLEPVPAALAAEARLLVAAERGRWIEPVERVRPHDAGTQAVGHPEDPRSLLR